MDQLPATGADDHQKNLRVFMKRPMNRCQDSAEKSADSIVSTNERTVYFVFLVFITMMAMLMRISLFPIESGDYHQFLHPWFVQLKEAGGLLGIGVEIGDYMPPYFYILALLTYLPVKDLIAIKLVSCIADIILASMVFRLVRLRWRNPGCATAAYCVVLFLPSVFLNSAAWAQCDAIFVSALLAFLYHASLNHSNRAVFWYAVAFVFKLQAVFLGPMVLYLLLKRRIYLRSIWIFPAVYLAACLPAAMMGRNLWDLLTVYFNQAKQYNLLAMFLPNPYTWFGDSTSPEISRAGVFLAGSIVLCTLFYLWRHHHRLTNGWLVSLALFFSVLVPFLLPHMHERYYYLADVLSIVFVFYFPQKWYVPVAICTTSAYTVCHNLFNTDFVPVQYLSILILVVLLLIGRHILSQMKLLKESAHVSVPEFSDTDVSGKENGNVTERQ